MGSFGTEFKVGLFTIIAMGILGYMFFVLSPEAFDGKEFNTYYTTMKNAANIIPRTHVKTNGVSVGKVKSIKLEENRTRVEIEVDASIKVPAGSKVEIRTTGLLGDAHIEIIRVPNDVAIENGGYIPVNEDNLGMNEVISLVGSIAQDVKKVTETLANVLGGEKGERTVSNIVNDIEKVTRDARLIVEENRQSVRNLVQNLEDTTATLRNVLGGREADLNAIVSNIRDATKDFREFSASIREVVDDENKARIDRIIARFDDSMGDVQETANSVKLVAARLERGEGTLGKLINDDSTISELESTLKEIRDVIKPATKLQVAVDYHGEIRKDKTTQHYFNLKMQTRPDKYYLLGFTDVDASVTDKTVEDLGDGRTKETKVEKSAIRFNLQFAKRWYFAGVRFGLFESTGGIAGDFYLLDDAMRFSIEAFDWDNSDEALRNVARIKTYVSILLFNHVYLIAGVDDVTRYKTGTKDVDPDLNVFGGAGLYFTDEDLKAIFGTAAIASQL